MNEVLKELQEIKTILNTKQNNEYELLTISDLNRETGIGENTLLKMFKDKNLEVQTYTHPFKVTRKSWNEYISKRHDYLSNK